MCSISTIHDGLDTMDWMRYSSIESFEMQERDESIDEGALVQTIAELDTSEVLDLTPLKSVLPQPTAENYLPHPFVDGQSTQDLVKPQYQQLLFSLANNFAGLDGANMGKVFRFLQNATSQRFF